VIPYVADDPVPAPPPGAADTLNARHDAVLLVCAYGALVARAERVLAAAGSALAIACRSTGEATVRIEEAVPDLVVLDAPADDDAPLGLLRALRDDPETAAVPVLVLTDPGDSTTTLRAFALGADDVVCREVSDDELAARVAVRLDRRPVPRERLVIDPVTGATTEAALAARLAQEVERARREGRPGSLAYLSLHELPHVQARLGSRARDELLAQVVRLIQADGRKLDLVGLSRGQLALLLPGTPADGARVRLERLSRKLYEHEFTVGGDRHRFTPALGFAETAPDVDAAGLEARAWNALMYATEQLDLYPTRWRPQLDRRPDRAPSGLRERLQRLRTPLQVAVQQLLCFGVPLGLYFALDRLGFDVTGWVYLVVVAALAFTAIAIAAESLAALRRAEPPPLDEARPLPPASAVIAAYLPNEAATVVETVEAFLRQDYPDLQIVLAYNTPTPLPVEDELRAIAARDPRFEPVRVEGSASKAQNVNAALARVRGAFVGIFDADHHPAPGSFVRAWRWLASGADVVQGHCVVRNGSDTALSRLVATEFETIYAVSHPGRARLHGFGIFGGSNGYWRREVIERTRMRSFMLTEDIDSSLRVVRAGGRIVSDPGLVSTELAPDRLPVLWNQRMRWAQGWSQVALRHLRAALRSRELTLRQKLGCLHLLGWRELFPWLSLQTLVILTYWLLRSDPPVSWFVPVFVATTLLTFSAGPLQAWTAWRMAHPSIRRHGGWFVLYGVASQLFYAELKNVIARTAHIKEAMRERKWKVTPRATSPRGPASGGYVAASATPSNPRPPHAFAVPDHGI
jgi:cellulose synthase/poly-beta-1,6-N-acetylglucosamine synthase-like glycosyltransferase/DNA-binding response OmpR family regulator